MSDPPQRLGTSPQRAGGRTECLITPVYLHNLLTRTIHENQLTTGIAVFAATSVLFLGIGAAIAATTTTTTISPFAPGA